VWGLKEMFQKSRFWLIRWSYQKLGRPLCSLVDMNRGLGLEAFFETGGACKESKVTTSRHNVASTEVTKS
jgi:hypothetical protein